MDTGRSPSPNTVSVPGGYAQNLFANPKYLESVFRSAQTNAPASGNAIDSLGELKKHTLALRRMVRSTDMTMDRRLAGYCNVTVLPPSGQQSFLTRITAATPTPACLWLWTSSTGLGFKTGDLLADPTEPWNAVMNTPWAQPDHIYVFNAGGSQQLELSLPITPQNITAFWDPVASTWTVPAPGTAYHFAFSWSLSADVWTSLDGAFQPCVEFGFVNADFSTSF